MNAFCRSKVLLSLESLKLCFPLSFEAKALVRETRNSSFGSCRMPASLWGFMPRPESRRFQVLVGVAHVQRCLKQTSQDFDPFTKTAADLRGRATALPLGSKSGVNHESELWLAESIDVSDS